MTQTETREDHGLANALAWFQSIKEMVDALESAEKTGEGSYIEQEQATIQESVLSVEVRSPWYVPDDGFSSGGANGHSPAEYRILLPTGGPACQLVGELDEHGEPESARLQAQDRFKPWEEVRKAEIVEATSTLRWQTATPEAWTTEIETVDQTLLTFARQFYFGEG